MPKRIEYIDDDQWKAERAKGIGASDAAAILGLSTWQSPMSLYLLKTGQIVDDSDSIVMKRGRQLERAVLEIFEEETGYRVEHNRDLFVHDKYDFIRSTPDGIISDTEGVEAKTATGWGTAKWEDGIPEVYQVQGYHQMLVMGWERVYFPVLLNGREFQYHVLERDEPTIDAIRLAVIRFWENLQQGIPPEVDGSDATTQAVKALFSMSDPETPPVEIGVMMYEMLLRREQAKKEVEALEKEIAQIENALKLQLGEAEGATYNGIPIATWKTSSRSSIDTKLFKERYPHFAQRLTKQSPVRTLRISIK